MPASRNEGGHFFSEIPQQITIKPAEGDLLALNVTEGIERNHPLIETVLRVKEAGSFCIAHHPMAGGLGMKSLSAHTIIKSPHNPEMEQTLINLEAHKL